MTDPGTHIPLAGHDPATLATWLNQGAPALFECRMRLAWSEVDSQAVSKEVRRFIEAAPYAIHIECEGEEGQASWYRMIEPHEELFHLAGISRLLGYWLDGQRAALNYIAYQLAVKAIREDKSLQLQPESVEFPIFDDRRVFHSKNRIKKFPKRFYDAIEAEQPYHGKNDGLWILHELAREYRHRTLQPIMAMLVGQPIHVLHRGHEIADVTPGYTRGPITHEVVVVKFRVPGMTDCADVHANVPVAIGIDHTLCADRDCVSVINEVNGAVIGTVERLESLF